MRVTIGFAFVLGICWAAGDVLAAGGGDSCWRPVGGPYQAGGGHWGCSSSYRAAAEAVVADWRKVPPGWQRDPGSAPPTQQAAVKAARDRWDHLPRPVQAAYP
jgi:hypothetical protein